MADTILMAAVAGSVLMLMDAKLDRQRRCATSPKVAC
jgi:hypothetical protein